MIDVSGGASHAGDNAPFKDLLDRRDRVNGWLARLDSQADIQPRVAERVRGDYLDQLQSIMNDLAGHYDALREQRSRLDADIAEARDAGSAAREALEEAELRHRVGELDAVQWEIRRAELQPAADDTAAEIEDLLRLANELDDVIAEIRDGLDTAHRPPLPGMDARQPDTADAPEIVSESVEIGREDASPPAPAPDGDDGRVTDEEGEDTRPRPGVKCADCGYTNDYGALYCGVCGVDLA